MCSSTTIVLETTVFWDVQKVIFFVDGSLSEQLKKSSLIYGLDVLCHPIKRLITVIFVPFKL
jgi:hypothetical protein